MNDALNLKVNLNEIIEQENKAKQEMQVLYEQISKQSQKHSYLQQKREEELQQLENLQQIYKKKIFENQRTFQFQDNQIQEIQSNNESVQQEDIFLRKSIGNYINQVQQAINNELEQNFLQDKEKFLIKPLDEIEYSPCSICQAICIKYQENQTQYIQTFAFQKYTTIKDIKKIASDYWNLSPSTTSLHYKFGEIIKEIIIPKKTYGQETIEKFFQKQGDISMNAEFILINNDKNINLQQNNKIDQVEKDIQTIQLLNQDEQIESVKKYINFFKIFPLLKNHLKLTKKQVLKGNNKEKSFVKSQDNSCKFIIFLTFIIIWNWVYISSNFNISKIYNEHFILKKSYLIEEFAKVKSIDDYHSFITQIISSNLFLNESFLNHNYLKVGTIRLRQVRINQKECKYLPKKQEIKHQLKPNCYYLYYNQESLNRSALVFESRSYQIWEKFHTQQESLIKSSFNGVFNQYDGSGYFLDLPKYLIPFQVKFQLEDIKMHNFIDQASLAVFFTFNLYNPSNNYFYFFQFFLEKNTIGNFITLPVVIRSFNISIYDNIQQTIIDILKFILALIVLYQICYGIYKLGFFYIFKIQGAINVALLLFLIINLIKSQQLSSKGIEFKKMMLIITFNDYDDASRLYNQIQNFQVSCLALMLLRLLCLFQLNKKFLIIINSFEYSIFRILQCLIILILLFISFAFFIMQQWGFSYKKYAILFIYLYLHKDILVSQIIFCKLLYFPLGILIQINQ